MLCATYCQEEKVNANATFLSFVAAFFDEAEARGWHGGYYFVLFAGVRRMEESRDLKSTASPSHDETDSDRKTPSSSSDTGSLRSDTPGPMPKYIYTKVRFGSIFLTDPEVTHNIRMMACCLLQFKAASVISISQIHLIYVTSVVAEERWL